MAQVRETIEQGFGKVLQYFAYVDFPKGQKMYLQPVVQLRGVKTFFTPIKAGKKPKVKQVGVKKKP